jgi:hypothetical protein
MLFALSFANFDLDQPAAGCDRRKKARRVAGFRFTSRSQRKTGAGPCLTRQRRRGLKDRQFAAIPTALTLTGVNTGGPGLPYKGP